jgi:hypothetical protein
MNISHVLVLAVFTLLCPVHQGARASGTLGENTVDLGARQPDAAEMTSEQAKSRAIEHARARALPVVDFRIEAQRVADVWQVTFLPPTDGAGASYKIEVKHPTGEIIRVTLEE